MSVIQERDNAYAAVTQVGGAVSETEQRRLEQQAEVYSRLAGWTLDALGFAPGTAFWRWAVAAGRCSRLRPHESVRPVGLWASMVIRGWSKPRKDVLRTYPGSTWSRPTRLAMRRMNLSMRSIVASC